MDITSELIDLGVDFETFYDDDYSLKKMENAEYVMDPRFEIVGVSLKWPGQPAQWISGTIDEIHAELAKIDWSKVRVVAHNARFEGSILEWRLGFQPAAYLCTMVGSRPHLVPYAGGQGLDDISRHLGLPPKGDYVHNVSGVHRVDLTPQQLADYGLYCNRDSENSAAIGGELCRILPIDEQYLIDLTIKKYVRPTLNLNYNALTRRLEDLRNKKQAALQVLASRYGIGDGGAGTLKQIRSRTSFAALLGTALGDEKLVPKKINKNGQLTYAFAKDDLAFKQLQAHPSEKVRVLVGSKLAFSSTLEESRTEKLIELCQVMGGKLPVPIVYYGAHTGRFSGDHGINLQNLPRVEYAKDKVTLVKGHLRFAIEADAGYSIIAADLSNIEARLVATLARQWDLVRAFAEGRDIYSEFASKIYGFAVNKHDHPLQRFVGKTCILGLGYGMGWKKFHLKMMQEGVVMDDREAMRIVQLYRDTYPNIPKLWRYLEQLAATYVTVPGSMFPSPIADLIFAHERIILPNGMPIIYPSLTRTGDGLKFRSRYGATVLSPELEPDADAGTALRAGVTVVVGAGQNIWGGAFTENISQALARIILTRAELTLARHGLPAALQVHDELVFKVPTKIVSQVKGAIAKVMTRKVDFLPDLPVAVEIHDGPTYGDAK